MISIELGYVVELNVHNKIEAARPSAPSGAKMFIETQVTEIKKRSVRSAMEKETFRS